MGMANEPSSSTHLSLSHGSLHVPLMDLLAAPMTTAILWRVIQFSVCCVYPTAKINCKNGWKRPVKYSTVAFTDHMTTVNLLCRVCEASRWPREVLLVV